MGLAMLLLAPGASAGMALEVAKVADPPPTDCSAGAQPPAAPAHGLRARLGQYGSGDGVLDVFEVCGRLHVAGHGLADATLTPRRAGQYTVTTASGAAEPLTFDADADAVTWRGERLVRHDLGAETQARIRSEVRADPDRLRRTALAAKPPVEAPSNKPSELVSVQALDPTIRMHTIYATTDNFLGIKVYERPGAFLQRPAAEALVRVQKRLRGEGYGLLITDAYRPWFATKMFWDATPEVDHIFVADPAEGSKHNRGAAVDLTLYSLATGRPVEMTGHIDEMSPRSEADYAGGTSRQRWYRALLRRAMEAEGFAVYPHEWWHFDYKDWKDYPIGTATYTELAAGHAH